MPKKGKCSRYRRGSKPYMKCIRGKRTGVKKGKYMKMPDFPTAT